MLKYMALSSIAKVDDFYANALDSANRIKGRAKPLLVKNHRRNLSARANEHGYGFFFWVARLFYKVMRTLYTMYHFYFFPYSALLITYAANWMRE